MTWVLIGCAALGFALGTRVAFSALFIASLLIASTCLLGVLFVDWPLASCLYGFFALAVLQGAYLLGAYVLWAGRASQITAPAQISKG